MAGNNHGPPPPALSPARTAQLPSISTLTSNLPGVTTSSQQSPTHPFNPRERDSGNWSAQSTHSSTRSSAYSASNSYYHPISSSISSPVRASNSSQLQLGVTSYPQGYNSGGAQASPGFAPPHQHTSFPTNFNHDTSHYRTSHEFPPQESRRSSLGSQLNSGLNNLHMSNGAQSPYHSTNASQTSIATGLQNARGISSNPNGIRNSRSSGQQPLSPLGPFTSEPRMSGQLPGESRAAFASRTAPVISANPKRDIYNAEKATPGEPWAFPDTEVTQRSSVASGEPFLMRRGSGHTSITSSILTNDSRLPPGQRRLDEEVAGTHHHSLQHKQVSSLADDSNSPEATSPYSRTPALRASHKMAERKRRHEMKTLFDNLRNQIPSYQGAKSSKWEILTKASEYIKALETSAEHGQQAETQLNHTAHELDRAKHDNETLRAESERLKEELKAVSQFLGGQQAPMHPPQPQYGAVPSRPVPDPSRSLPPLTNGGAVMHSSMQGVQYSDERR